MRASSQFGWVEQHVFALFSAEVQNVIQTYHIKKKFAGSKQQTDIAHSLDIYRDWAAPLTL